MNAGMPYSMAGMASHGMPPPASGMQPYGNVYGSGYPQGYGAAPAFEGEMGYPAKPSPFMRGAAGPRKPVNIAGLMLAVLIPWFLFSFLYAALSFRVHYEQPAVCKLILIGAAGVVLYFGYSAILAYRREDANWTWYSFFFVTCLIAYLTGFVLGNQNYFSNMRPYFDITNLSEYPSVDPVATKGQQLMDMGAAVFTEGSKLDLTKSMGFRNLDVYCVAPIVSGNASANTGTYDFWAVGLNCCSGHLADFGCGEYNNPSARSGLRLMRDDLRPYFRLAVEQAESAYNIKSRHPIFVYWMQDPDAEVSAYADEGYKRWLLSMLIFFLLQLVVVMAAAMKL